MVDFEQAAHGRISDELQKFQLNFAMEFEYQVFLSHNSADKPEVKLLANRLRRQTGLRPFLDEWNLVPGESSQAKLVAAIETSATAAIFYGPHKEGPWQAKFNAVGQSSSQPE